DLAAELLAGAEEGELAADARGLLGGEVGLELDDLGGRGEAAIAARQQLVLRYYGAVYRYLLGMLHDPAVAEDLTQEFAVRLLRGDFKHFDPQRGRFRDYVKIAVRHLVMDYWKKKKKSQERK